MLKIDRNAIWAALGKLLVWSFWPTAALVFLAKADSGDQFLWTFAIAVALTKLLLDLLLLGAKLASGRVFRNAQSSRQRLEGPGAASTNAESFSKCRSLSEQACKCAGVTSSNPASCVIEPTYP